MNLGLRASQCSLDADLQALASAALRVLLLVIIAGSPVGMLWLAQVRSDAAPYLWAGALSALCLGGFALSWYQRSQDAGQLRQAQWRDAAILLTCGAGWGTLALLAPYTMEPAQHLALTLLVLPIALLATVMLCASRSGFAAFASGVLIPLGLRSVLNPAPLVPFGAWGVLMVGVLLLTAHALLHRVLARMLAQRIDSEHTAREQQVIFNAATEGILFVRNDRVVKCNTHAAGMFAAHLDEMRGTAIARWHATPSLWEQKRKTLAKPGDTLSYTACLRRLDGSTFLAELSARAIAPEDPAQGEVWIVSDISARAHAEAQLRKSEMRFRRLVSMSSDWYWEQDADLRFTQLSGGATEEMLTPAQEVMGKCRWELPNILGVSEEEWAEHKTTLAARQPFSEFIYRMQATDGEIHWVSVSGYPMYDEEGAFCGYHGVSTDITDKVAAAERFRHLAHHDTLTGLPNRRLLDDRLDQAVAQARRWGLRVVVMLIDLDDFKLINDSAGHATGDEVLITIAQRLRKLVRESDTVARLGGDEFVVLLPSVDDPRDVHAVAEKLVATIREPVTCGKQQFMLGASIGIAFYPDHGDNAAAILAQADAAMYASKRDGGGWRQAPLPRQPELPLDFSGSDEAASRQRQQTS